MTGEKEKNFARNKENYQNKLQLYKLFLVSFFFCVGIASEKERSKCAAQRAIERDKEIVSYIHERERERRHLTRTQLHKRHRDRNTERERGRET